jgi:transcriptional regulator GlxA family with amidase domain
MKITIVAFEGCMTSAVYGQADAFAIAAYISNRRGDGSWSGHEVRIATPDGKPVPGYGGHAIAPHYALAEAKDSDVILIPPIFNDIETTLAVEVWPARLAPVIPERSGAAGFDLHRRIFSC